MLEIAEKQRRHLVQDLRKGHVFDRRSGSPRLPELEKALQGPDGRRANELERLRDLN